METQGRRRLQILSGTYNEPLAQHVAAALGMELSPVTIERFANGEIRCKLGESARGADVFIFQAHAAPVNDAIMEQAILIDAVKRASAKRITAVCPFLGYARQDRKSSGREPISAKLVIDILAAAGADRIVTVDLHSGQIQGFFDGPFDHLTAMPVLMKYIQEHLGPDLVIVSPDAGRVKTSERYATQLGTDLAIVHKRRSTDAPNQAKALAVIGEVKGRRCVLIDDMIDTAGTIVAAAEILQKEGAKEIYVMATHGVFSEPATTRLAAAPIKGVVVTDTLPPKADIPHLTVLTLAPLVASAIRAIFMDESVSSLFGGRNLS